ncbi:MAG: hypothetical protein IPJ41_14600 [Phycisphaerales bacterium]|nr:hypothetical protein [Phycisphaerales bacterium]
MANRIAARAMKPLVVGLAIALLVVGVVGVIALRTLGPGTGGLGGVAHRLESWIGSQIVGIANSYLVPQIAFESLDYEAPGTVHLKGVTLTAPDGTRVLELDGMTVELAEVPRLGQPLVIERIDLDRPVVHLIRETGADGASGFRGLSPIAKASPGHDEEVEPSFRLSNVLRLRRIQVNDGSLAYDQADGSPPMVVRGLTTTIIASPAAGEEGWYALDIDSALGPLARLQLKGAFSLDSLEAKIEQLDLSSDLGPDSRSILPPEIQTLVAAYEARGRFDLAASGRLSLADPMAGSLQATVSLESAHFASGDYQIPLDRLAAEATLGSGILTLTSLRAEMLGGAVTAQGDVETTVSTRPAHIFWTLEDLDLQRLLRTGSPADEPPKLAGTLSGGGSATSDLSDPLASLDGKGDAHVRDGRLMVLPGLSQLAQAMHVMSAGMLSKKLNHKADAEFTLGPAGVIVTSSQVTTEFLAARATGDIAFDGTLNLSVNAGPMEKLQSMLGGVGDLLGSVTDRLVTYRIRGTVAEPQVSVAPLGVGG